jgi:hypothetical protein
LLDFRVADLPPETVSTEKQNVGLLEQQRLGRNVGIDFVPDPYCGGQNMPLGMAFGVFGKDGTSLKKAGNQCMVASQQAQTTPCPEQI